MGSFDFNFPPSAGELQSRWDRFVAVVGADKAAAVLEGLPGGSLAATIEHYASVKTAPRSMGYLAPEAARKLLIAADANAFACLRWEISTECASWYTGDTSALVGMFEYNVQE